MYNFIILLIVYKILSPKSRVFDVVHAISRLKKRKLIKQIPDMLKMMFKNALIRSVLLVPRIN